MRRIALSLALALALLSPAAALADDVIAGPALSNNIGNWNESGMYFTALNSVTLESFTYENQGGADTVRLMNHSTGAILETHTTPAGQPMYSAVVNWDLTAGVTYRITWAGGSNGRWVGYTSFPTSGTDLSVHGVVNASGGTYQTWWFSFTDLVTTGTNDDPTISAIPDQETDEDTPILSIPFTIGDTEDGPSALTLVTASTNTTLIPDENLVLGGSGANRTIDITPAADQFGDASILITVEDSEGATAFTSFTVDVLSVNDLPTADAGSNYSGDEGANIQLDGSASTDLEGPIAVYDWDCDNDGVYEQTSTGPTIDCVFDDDGSYTVGLRAEDADGGQDTDTASVTVANVAPTAGVSGPSATNEGTLETFTGTGSDPSSVDEAALTFTWEVLEASVVIGSGAGNTASWTFPDQGTYEVAFTVTDPQGASHTATDSVTVSNVAPTITSVPSVPATEAIEYTYEPTATDPGLGDGQTWTLDSGPAGMTIDAGSGDIAWTPGYGDVGAHSVTITVDDGDGGTDSQTWTILVDYLDTDGDDMPDTWETDNGLDPGDPADAFTDPDADGLTNLDEWNAGQDPQSFDGPTAPVLAAPIGGEEVATTQPLLQWTNATDPQGEELTYEVQVFADAAATIPLTADANLGEDPSGTTGWTTDVVLGENFTIYWRARAADLFVDGPWSTLESAFVNETDEPPPVPVPLFPLDGEVVAQAVPQLVWAEVEDPDQDAVSYHVRLWDEGLTTVLGSENVDGAFVAEGSWEVDVAVIEDTVYAWDVNATDEDGLSSDYSDPQPFLYSTEDAAPADIAWVDPLEGDEVESVSPDLTATESSDPEGTDLTYTFEADTASTFDSPDLVAGSADHTGTGEVTLSLEDEGEALAENQDWHLRVRAEDAAGLPSNWASITVFVRGPNDPPAVPVLIEPEDGSSSTELRPVLVLAHSEDPEGDDVRYDVVISRDAEGTDVVDSTTDLAPSAGPGGTDARTSWQPGADLEVGTFYWTARAIDEFEAASEDAEPFEFTIDAEGDDDDDDDDDDSTGDDDDDDDDDDGGSTDCNCSSSLASTGGGAPATLLLGLIALVGLRRRR